jgi:hypothetical protein
MEKVKLQCGDESPRGKPPSGERARLARWFWRLAETIYPEKFAMAGRHRRHARRVRFPRNRD